LILSFWIPARFPSSPSSKDSKLAPVLPTRSTMYISIACHRDIPTPGALARSDVCDLHNAFLQLVRPTKQKDRETATHTKLGGLSRRACHRSSCRRSIFPRLLCLRRHCATDEKLITEQQPSSSLFRNNKKIDSNDAQSSCLEAAGLYRRYGPAPVLLASSHLGFRRSLMQDLSRRSERAKKAISALRTSKVPR
jgi:hypothetical protein